VVEDAGHMVHHDQPERIAQAIRDFVARRVDVAR
jgi:pimeloyl-ACP methyl ester carboxylesterase